MDSEKSLWNRLFAAHSRRWWGSCLAAYLAFHFEQEHKRHYPGPPIPLAESETAPS